MMRSGAAFAVLSATSGWVKVSWDEIADNGTPISAAKLETIFPKSDLSKIPNISVPEDKVATSNMTIMNLSSVVLSSPKNKAHSVNEYAYTYKDSEDRWLAEAHGYADAGRSHQTATHGGVSPLETRWRKQ
jgi:hypothetical protein